MTDDSYDTSQAMYLALKLNIGLYDFEVSWVSSVISVVPFRNMRANLPRLAGIKSRVWLRSVALHRPLQRANFFFGSPGAAQRVL